MSGVQISRYSPGILIPLFSTEGSDAGSILNPLGFGPPGEMKWVWWPSQGVMSTATHTQEYLPCELLNRICQSDGNGRGAITIVGAGEGFEQPGAG